MKSTNKNFCPKDSFFIRTFYFCKNNQSMKNFITTLTIILLLAISGCKSGKTATANGNSTRSILIIFYDSSFPADFLANSIRNYGSDIIYSYDTLKGFAVTVPEGKTEKEAISYFSNLKGILSVQPDRKMILHDR